MFTNPRIHPLALKEALDDRLGPDWPDWDPVTVRLEVEELSPNLSRVVWQKIQALKTALTVVTPWIRWEAFLPVCDAFNSKQPDFSVISAPTLGEMAFTVVVLSELDPKTEFSPEVAKFVAATALYWGQFFLPEPLDFAQKYALDWKYKCRTCGKVGEVDPDDPPEICPVCSGKYLSDHPFSPDLRQKPLELIALMNGKGKLDIYPSYDVQAVYGRFEEVKKGSPLGETVEDFQIARALKMWRYVEEQNASREDSSKGIR